MGNTFLNIVSFILITILYYLALKPKLTIEILTNADSYKKYNKSLYFNLAIYFLLIIIIQFGINAGVIINKCGGSVSQNIGLAGLMTFLPWVLIFGVVMIILIVFPGFKGAFSDVIGYFYVSKSANDALTELLMDTNVYNKIDNVDAVVNANTSASGVPAASSSEVSDTFPNLELDRTKVGGSKKQALQDAADAIIKLCGNMSILINQIVPSNFLQYMEMLKPLMKPQYQNNSELLKEAETKLLEVVITRDNIGEAFWYVYAAILIISIVQYNIVSRPCIKDSATMEANYKKFLADQEITNKEKARGQGVYTIKN